MKPRFTMEDIRRSYDRHKRWTELEGDLPSFLFYRPLSFWISFAFLRCSIPPLAVTLASTILALLMPIVVWQEGSWAAYEMAMILVVLHLFDCVDGNMARTLAKTSALGAFLDFFTDVLVWTALFPSLGILVEQEGDRIFQGHAIDVGLLLSLLVALNRLLRDGYQVLFGKRAEWLPAIPDKVPVWIVARSAFISLERLYAFAIILGHMVHALDVVMAVIAGYVGILFLATITLLFIKTMRLDQLRRG